MEPGGTPDILHVQGQPMLQTVDAFVLRSVVLKKPPDILHHGNRQNIAHENADPEQAFDHRGQKRMMDKTGKQGRDQIGKHKEQADGDHKGNGCHSALHDLIHFFRPGRLFRGLVLLCVLFLLFIKRS